MANFKLNQTGEQIQADLNLLDNNSATQGQVLTANGTGGASWQNASGGVYMYIYQYKNVKKCGNYTLKNKTDIYALAISSEPLNLEQIGTPVITKGVYMFFIYNKIQGETILPNGITLPIEGNDGQSNAAFLPKIASYNFENHYVGCSYNTVTNAINDAVTFDYFIVNHFKNENGNNIVPIVTSLTEI